MAYLYILRGNKDFYYCGITQDVVKRVIGHNKGFSISTRKHVPLLLEYLKEFESMRRARTLEKIIKNRGVKKWLQINVGKIHVVESDIRIYSLYDKKLLPKFKEMYSRRSN